MRTRTRRTGRLQSSNPEAELFRRAIGVRLPALLARALRQHAGGTPPAPHFDAITWQACETLLDELIDFLAVARGRRPVSSLVDAYDQLDGRNIDVKVLGAVYEQLLERRPAVNGDRQANHRTHRRATGSFYTPGPIVAFIVREATGPLVDAKIRAFRPTFERDPVRTSPRLINDLLDAIRIVDPAMGCGYFLLEAADFVADRLLAFFATLAKPPPMAMRPDWLRREVALRCLAGVDFDPTAVRLSRASLWLHAGGSADTSDLFAGNLRHGDSLSFDWPAAFPKDFAGERTGFDAVIGNPPYGPLPLPARTAHQARPETRPYAFNAAAAFIHLSVRRLAPHGRVVLIVPKSLTYSTGWSATLGLVLPTLESLVDASQAFPGVLLEQVIVCIAPKIRSTYRGGELSSEGLTRGPRIEKSLQRELHSAVCSCTVEELALARKLIGNSVQMSSVVRVDRGGPWQQFCNDSSTSAVIGGKAIGRFTIDREKLGRMAGRSDPRIVEDRQPKIVAQNIIAHITRPEPHIRIMAAWDAEGRATLDTVNRIWIKDPSVSPAVVLAILNSTLTSWFAWRFIYNRAVRTMHFDADYVGRLRYRDPSTKERKDLDRLVSLDEGALQPDQREIDRWVYGLFKLTKEQRELSDHASARRI